MISRMTYILAACAASTRSRQILAGAKTGVHVEKVLDAVAVIGIQLAALLPDRTDPQGGDTQVRQIVQLPNNAANSPALPVATGGIQAALSPAANWPGCARSNKGPSLPFEKRSGSRKYRIWSASPGGLSAQFHAGLSWRLPGELVGRLQFVSWHGFSLLCSPNGNWRKYSKYKLLFS